MVNSFFFKNVWSTVGEDVIETVKEFFTTGGLLKQFNTTTLTIIPKVQNPVGLNDFRPKVCCTVIYKVMTKIITSRMGKVLGKIINMAQLAFVPGKRIVENILLAHEIVNYHKGHGVIWCAMKVDLRKSYDSIQWDFVEEIFCWV